MIESLVKLSIMDSIIQTKDVIMLDYFIKQTNRQHKIRN